MSHYYTFIVAIYFHLFIQRDWAKHDFALRGPRREHNITLRATPRIGTISSEGE